MSGGARWRELEWTARGGMRVAEAAGPWFRGFELHEVEGALEEQRTAPDEEALLVVLAGTHDLFAGSGAWLRRGIRGAPWEGRPVAVFLPPGTRWRAADGAGRLLLARVRRPEAESPDTEAEGGPVAAPRKPLLPLAGGKAFDARTGTWLPQEAFPDSPEAILPRRIASTLLPDGTVHERVVGADYKALGLCVDEVRLAPGGRTVVAPPELPGGPPAEVACLVLAEGAVRLDGRPVPAGSAFVAPGGPVDLECRDGRATVLLAYAGPKRST